MSEIVVSKFGGTSVADFDAMNRSADIVLSDANVRLVVLSASAGITNLLVALAEGLEPGERFEKLDAIRNIQFAILERLRYPNVIREEIERLLENITVLAEAAALATSPALTDELVSHGELMSTLLFVEILRERDVQAQWFDVRKVMRTNDRFGRAEPDVAALAELTALQLLPRLNEGLVITQDLSAAKIKVVQRRFTVEAAIIRQPCWRRLYTHLVLISGPTSRASTPPIHAWFPQQNALMKSRLPKRQRWQLLVQKYCIRQRCYPQYAAISRSLSAPAKTHAQVVRWCAIKLKIRRCSARWRFVAIRLCSLCTA